MKRKLLDQLAASHDFPVPPSMVDAEFNQIWTRVKHEIEHHGKSFEDEGTTEEKAKAEYRGIAERRVRLGLVIAEIGECNNIRVTDEELSRAVMDRARQVPGKEQEVWDFYRKNPEALASLRAPIFEDKVIDYILELAKVTETKVTPEELYADPDADHADHDHDHDHDHHHDHDHDPDHEHGHSHKKRAKKKG